MQERLTSTEENSEAGEASEKENRLTDLPLLDFIPAVTPRWDRPDHLKPLTDVLERAGEAPERIIVSVPPQHYKTETILHFVGQYVAKHPERTVGYVSYSQRQAQSKALKAQRIAVAAGAVPDPQMANQAEWRTLEGGGILATGIGGPLTGQRVDLLIVDDPVKNREEAESKTVQEKQWAWWEDVAEERLDDASSAVIVMTRWHSRDLAGQAISEQGAKPGEAGDWHVVRIPALADGLDWRGKNPEPDPVGREVGEALLPHKHSRETLEKKRRRKPLTFAAMDQGLPRPRSATLFGEPTFYDPADRWKSGFRYVIAADLAYTEKSRADASAIVVLAVRGSVAGDDLEVRVVRVIRVRYAIGKTIRLLGVVQKTYGARVILETNGPQKAVADFVESSGIRIDRVNPTEDKYTRAQPAGEAWNAGVIQVPERAHWLGELLEEVGEFTGVGNEEDDQVDALAHAYARAERRGPAMIAV